MAERSIRDDYLNPAAPLRQLYEHPPENPDWAAVIRGRQNFPAHRREILSSVLHQQYQKLQVTPAQQAHLDKLKDEKTFTLTTGHQLVLMGGPIYTIYKIVSVISAAERLQQQFPDHHFIPIFWMATEDHDFDEINHFYADFDQKITYEAENAGPVGHHIIQPGLADKLKAAVPAAWAEVYTSGKSLAEATRDLFHRMFGKYGLIILDADHPSFKKEFREVMKSDILNGTVADLLNKGISALEELGYKVQASGREINFFLMDGGSRERIERSGDQFQLVESGREITASGMASIIDKNPEKLSPNVILRPLYQEMILPNLAYSGGWAEVSYWLELKPIFDHFLIPFPVVMPRFSVTLFPEDEAESWRELGLEIALVTRPEHEIFAEKVAQLHDLSSWEAEKQQMLGAFGAGIGYLEGIDPTLARSLTAQKVRNENFLNKLNQKLRRSIRRKHPKTFDEIRRIRQAVSPQGLMQERVLNWTAFTDDPDELIAFLIRQCNPFLYQHHTLIWRKKS